MGNKPDSKGGIQDWVKNLSAGILGAIALVKGITEFVKLFQGSDAELLTWITLIACITLLCAICLYYARFWQPEKDDKGTSGFTPQTDEWVKQQAGKEKGRKLIRRSAVAGLVLIPLLSLSGFGYWQHLQNQPSKDIIILVADFDGPDPQKYGVSELIRENLRSATLPYEDVKVKPLGRVITESDGKEVAKEEGKKRKAAIVIWGWYRQPKNDLLVNTHFQVLKPIDYFLDLNKGVTELQRLSLDELESFNIKIRPASQMSYLTLVTLGISRYAAEDWDGAIERFDAALKQSQEPIQGLSHAIVYFYRAASSSFKKDYKQAIHYFDQAIILNPNYPVAYHNRGYAKYELGNQKGAIQDYDKAITLDSRYAFAYVSRGNAKANLGLKEGAIQDYDEALRDYDKAIILDPKDAFSYCYRALIYQNQGDKQNAIQNFKKALEVTQNPVVRKTVEQELKKLEAK